MSRTVRDIKEGIASNIDKKIVVSTVVASFAVGAVVFALNKTNIKALQSLGKLAK